MSKIKITEDHGTHGCVKVFCTETQKKELNDRISELLRDNPEVISFKFKKEEGLECCSNPEQV